MKNNQKDLSGKHSAARFRKYFSRWFALLLSLGLVLTSVSLPEPVQAQSTWDKFMDDTEINPNFTIQHYRISRL